MAIVPSRITTRSTRAGWRTGLWSGKVYNWWKTPPERPDLNPIELLNIALLQNQTAPVEPKHLIKVLTNTIRFNETKHLLTTNRMFGNETLTQSSKLKLLNFNLV